MSKFFHVFTASPSTSSVSAGPSGPRQYARHVGHAEKCDAASGLCYRKKRKKEKLWYVCEPETEEGTLFKMEVLAGDKGLSTLYMWFCFQRVEDSGGEGGVAHPAVCCHHVVNNDL